MEKDIRINRIPTRILGQTGIRLTVLGLGGHTIGTMANHQSAISLIRTAIDEGINFLDNAWCYHGGESVRIMGEALRNGYRDKVFLMTKNHGRERKTFNEQLNESLKRLNTSYIDLLQIHNIVAEDDPEVLKKKIEDLNQLHKDGHLTDEGHKQATEQLQAKLDSLNK